jgi:excisionase family DNA binding protein
VTGEKQYLSIGQVADKLGVNPTTIYRLAQKGKLPGFKVGSQWRFSGDQLEHWVADQVTIEWLKAEDKTKDS